MNTQRLIFGNLDDDTTVHLGLRAAREAFRRPGGVWIEGEEWVTDATGLATKYHVFGFAERPGGDRVYFHRSVALDDGFDRRIEEFVRYVTGTTGTKAHPAKIIELSAMRG